MTSAPALSTTVRVDEAGSSESVEQPVIAIATTVAAPRRLHTFCSSVRLGDAAARTDVQKILQALDIQEKFSAKTG